MHLAIDASNIRQGGGLTHLSQMLCEADLSGTGISHVSIWSCRKTLAHLPDKHWLTKRSPAWTEGNLLVRIIGQQLLLSRELFKNNCQVLFSPGGVVPLFLKVPTVAMSQNLLPFEPDRAALFGRWSWLKLKMRLLRVSQGRSFQRAQGLIFLTRYASEAVMTALTGFKGMTALIPHGIEQRFVMQPRPQRSQQELTGKPLRLLYVSIQMPYKHHIELMRAVSYLRKQGRLVSLLMVGGHVSPYSRAVKACRLALDPDQDFIQDLRHVKFEKLHELYQQSDVFVFASSCENLPNILIEAMAAGLPIVCSHRGPMPEVLGNAGVYFDPESPLSIAHAIAEVADDSGLRAILAQRAWQRAKAYSWARCAQETFSFIALIARQYER